jgi:hypothetical protein
MSGVAGRFNAGIASTKSRQHIWGGRIRLEGAMPANRLRRRPEQRVRSRRIFGPTRMRTDSPRIIGVVEKLP